MVKCLEIIIFKFFFLFAIEIALLSVFWQKNGLGPLGVNCRPRMTWSGQVRGPIHPNREKADICVCILRGKLHHF